MSSLFFCLGYLETQRTLFSLIIGTLLNLAFSKHDSHLPSSPLLFVSLENLETILGASCFIIAMHFKVSRTSLHLEMGRGEMLVFFFSRVFSRHHMVWEFIKREWRQRKRGLK